MCTIGHFVAMPLHRDRVQHDMTRLHAPDYSVEVNPQAARSTTSNTSFFRNLAPENRGRYPETALELSMEVTDI